MLGAEIYDEMTRTIGDIVNRGLRGYAMKTTRQLGEYVFCRRFRRISRFVCVTPKHIIHALLNASCTHR